MISIQSWRACRNRAPSGLAARRSPSAGTGGYADSAPAIQKGRGLGEASGRGPGRGPGDVRPNDARRLARRGHDAAIGHGPGKPGAVLVEKPVPGLPDGHGNGVGRPAGTGRGGRLQALRTAKAPAGNDIVLRRPIRIPCGRSGTFWLPGEAKAGGSGYRPGGPFEIRCRVPGWGTASGRHAPSRWDPGGSLGASQGPCGNRPGLSRSGSRGRGVPVPQGGKRGSPGSHVASPSGLMAGEGRSRAKTARVSRFDRAASRLPGRPRSASQQRALPPRGLHVNTACRGRPAARIRWRSRPASQGGGASAPSPGVRLREGPPRTRPPAVRDAPPGLPGSHQGPLSAQPRSLQGAHPRLAEPPSPAGSAPRPSGRATGRAGRNRWPWRPSRTTVRLHRKAAACGTRALPVRVAAGLLAPEPGIPSAPPSPARARTEPARQPGRPVPRRAARRVSAPGAPLLEVTPARGVPHAGRPPSAAHPGRPPAPAPGRGEGSGGDVRAGRPRSSSARARGSPGCRPAAAAARPSAPGWPRSPSWARVLPWGAPS